MTMSDYERMSKPLKPCPFCGREALMKVYNHVPTGYDYTPTCTSKSCAGRLSKRFHDINLAISAWNKRAESESKRFDELKDFIEYIQTIKDNHNEKGMSINYGTICDIAIRGWKLLDNIQEPKVEHCKDCKHFEYDSVAKVDGIPLIVAHEICNKWGDGCKTKEDGYCFLFEPQESEE